MNRRSFLRRLCAAPLAAAAAVVALEHLPAPRAPRRAGVSERFIQQYEVDGHVTRYDVIYGVGTLRSDMGVRVWSA